MGRRLALRDAALGTAAFITDTLTRLLARSLLQFNSTCEMPFAAGKIMSFFGPATFTHHLAGVWTVERRQILF